MTDWINSLMAQLGYIGIAVLMFLDNVFPPIPSEIIMPSAGFAASQGTFSLWGVICAGSIGSLLAAAVLYGVGYWAGQERILKFVGQYGRWLRIKPEDLEKNLNDFANKGHRIVFFGRMVPAVRSLISIPAGISGMPFYKFMLYSAGGTILWTSFLACVGFYLGENQHLMQSVMQYVGWIILSMVALYVAYRIVKSKRSTST